MNVPQIPLLAAEDHAARSIFQAVSLLREARRQKNNGISPSPKFACSIRRRSGAAAWRGESVDHIAMFTFSPEGIQFGIVGCAVGSAFAVLIAKQAFASGCRFVISITSAGRIVANGPARCLVLIGWALRDESASYHYLPPADFAAAKQALAVPAMAAVTAGVGFVGGDLDHRCTVPGN